MESILLSCPIHQRKDYVIREWFDYILKLDYPNLSYYFVDNTDSPEWSEQLIKEYGFEIDWLIPVAGRRTHQSMCACNKLSRQKFLEGDYDYFFSLEADVFPPLDCINIMLSHNKPVVTLPYFTGEGEESFIVAADVEQYGQNITNRHVNAQESYWRTNGQLIQTQQPGVGCCLIARRVLETHDFETIKNVDTHSDTMFYFSLNKDKIPVYSDSYHICIHKNQSWSNVSDFKA